MPSGRRLARGLTTGLACFALLAALAARFTVEPILVTSSSMRPTLAAGDRVLVEKVTYRFRAPHRGEVVVITDPHGGTPLVKRVVAVGGDRVELNSGVLLVNDRVVPDRGAQPDAEVAEFFGPLDVPAEHLFVLGDNRAESDDSREFGSVDERRVIGRVWLGA
ncbi:MAG: signal peptidase [Acidimicrobiia bacterium]|nr:signal peptidase [Acidimicrobiia bacterium]